MLDDEASSKGRINRYQLVEAVCIAYEKHKLKKEDKEGDHMKYLIPNNHDFVDFDNPVSDRELDKRDLERRQEKFYDDLITIIIRERLYRYRKGAEENNSDPHK